MSISQVATIRASSSREDDQTFRYATLSERSHSRGRRAPCTAIDQEAGLIRLTTTLAHASGEWLSSEWPVCSIAETATPRRMGPAFTYAKRYALFTLVGIAGEDDFDAPDLGAGGASDVQPGLNIQTSPRPVADERPFAQTSASRKGKVIRSPKITLATDQSEVLRDSLVAELSDLKSTDEAADWVHKNLAAKSTLAVADAETVEASFRQRLATIERGQALAGSEQNDSGDEPLREQSQVFDSPRTPAPETNRSYSVRPDGAYHQWRKIPPRELSIDLVADERDGWATGRREAS